MNTRVEDRAPDLVGAVLQPLIADGPAGQQLGEADNVLLAVSALDPKRMQLERLAGQVFVEAATAASSGTGIGSDRQGVIEVEEHGRMQFGGKEQVLEPAEGVGADGFHLVGGREQGHGRRRHGDTEMIGPEADPALGKAGRCPKAQPCPCRDMGGRA